MIDRSFLEKVEEMAAPEKYEVDGITYVNKGLIPIFPPRAEALKIHTLTGIVDYLKDNRDILDLKEIIVHIENPVMVRVFSAIIGNTAKRSYYLESSPVLRRFPFEQYLNLETFLIRMQTHFVQTETVAAILKLVGNLTDNKTMNFNDDGVTQQVTAKSGIARVENVPVPNPIILAPFRTFLEVKQPESRFVFRIGQGNESPTCALFEADGGAWEINAMENIRVWLKTTLPDGVSILA